VYLRYVTLNRTAVGNTNGLIDYQPLESSIIVLGYGAIFLNALFLLIALILWMTGKVQSLVNWMLAFNFAIFLFQLYYFFFS
jgi:hypothetical protein